MSIAYAIACVSLGIIFVCIAIPFGLAFWSLFDHSKWLKYSNPNHDSTIIDRKIQTVHYLKNGKKYKTTIRFSDGFVFTTHKTNRSESFLTYRISIDGNLARDIQKKAIETHERAVNRRLKRGKVSGPRPVLQKKQLPAWICWLKAPYRIVAIVGVCLSVLINIFISSEEVHEFLFIMLLLPVVEIFAMMAIKCFFDMSKPFLAFIPIGVYFAILAVMSKTNNDELFMWISRSIPFMTTLSLAILVKGIRKIE